MIWRHRTMSEKRETRLKPIDSTIERQSLDMQEEELSDNRNRLPKTLTNIKLKDISPQIQ